MLTTQQKNILHLVRRGLGNAEIADVLKMRERTVKYHVGRLFLLFDVSNRTELAGLLNEPPVHAQSGENPEQGARFPNV